MLDKPPSALTAFQVEVARLFFSLSTGQLFLLAGGAALVAQQLSERPTDDLDFFTRDPAAVQVAKVEMLAACAERGWTVTVLRDSDTSAACWCTGLKTC